MYSAYLDRTAGQATRPSTQLGVHGGRNGPTQFTRNTRPIRNNSAPHAPSTSKRTLTKT